MLRLIAILLCFFSSLGFSQEVLKIAAWGGEIPAELVKEFEKNTGIKVYLSTFESNESLVVKLKSSKHNLYDLITPSNYYVEQLQKMDMLQEIDKSALGHLQEIDPVFLNKNEALYGLPFLWNATGIFYNQKWIKNPPMHWSELWSKTYKDQLLILDDTREVFSIALISLGYTPNDSNLADIQKAYLKLLQLTPNIKLFASDAMPRIMASEDAIIGMGWSGDIIKVQTENPNIKLIYPTEGFIISAECFAIPKHSSNVKAAIAFINFMTEPKQAATITRLMGFPVTNTKAKNYLPKQLAEDKTLFPTKAVMKKGILQSDVSHDALQEYQKKWGDFKLSF